MEANPFHHPRLAGIFEAISDADGDREDLGPYLAIVDELRARRIIDLGAGTGAFACRLAALGKIVTAVEPGAASMALARRRTGANQVRWIVGDAADMPSSAADLVTMTGNIPEHLDDRQWEATLAATHRSLRPGGHLVFGNRDVGAEPWLTSPEYAPRASPGNRNNGTRVESTPAGPVHHWLEILDLAPDAFTFRWTFLVEREETQLTWETTFRVRTPDQIVRSLEAASFTVTDVRDNHLFIAERRIDQSDG